MELQQYLQIGISAVGLLGAVFAYVLNLRIQHDILVNNEKIEKEISDAKTKLRDELVRELGGLITKNADILNAVERRQAELISKSSDLSTTFADRVLSIVNGKYVRSDLHDQTIIGINDKLLSMKELIEANLGKIEQGLDRQISDLKDRIFDNREKK